MGRSATALFTSPTGTPFTIPVDHKTCHTGISAAERARTVHAVLDSSSVPEDFRTPGHLFVLVAKEGGVLRRAGHTEATVDLARLAGLQPAGVLCEICSSAIRSTRIAASLPCSINCAW